MTTAISLAIILSVALISTTCVVSAAFLAWHQHKEWGWFLLVGFLIASSYIPVVKKVNYSKPINELYAPLQFAVTEFGGSPRY